MNEHIEDILVGGRPMTKLERANKEIERLKKENKELDKICARKSRCIDKKDLEIGRLKEENKDLQQRFDYLMEAHKICDEENERLNNNWNGLEKWIEKERDKWEKYNPDCFAYYQSILDRMKEI